MRITSFGCSLTFGTELSDDGNEPTRSTASQLSWTQSVGSQLTWPALISRTIGANYLCRAHGGSGNLSILDRVLFRHYYFPEDVFIINWTFADRFDYSDPGGHHFTNGLNDYATASPGKSDPVSNFYFQHIHSEYREKIITLMYIKTAIDQLTSAGSRFLMTSIDPVLFCQRWHAPPHVVKLQDEIRPYIHDFQGMNFLDWSRHRRFEISPAGHPLEEAHAAAAELMLLKIKQILQPGIDKK